MVCLNPQVNISASPSVSPCYRKKEAVEIVVLVRSISEIQRVHQNFFKMGEVGSIKPNPYIFDIENRRKRKPRLAHDLGAGAKCKKCGDKCSGFELHFWRKICMNCRCGKDDHEIEDDDEDIGRIVIGKLFDRPARTEKEEREYCFGNDLEIVNEETGKAENVKFDWVPPNVEKTLASRYMEMLPPEKRPIAGSEAAKERRRQLEQQLPLYDMDAAKRCDTLPPEELQNFQAYLERIRTQVAGQGTVQQIAGPSAPMLAQPFLSPAKPNAMPAGSLGGNLDANGNIGLYPDTLTGNDNIGQSTQDQANIQNNNVGLEEMQNYSMHGQPQLRYDSKLPSLRQQFLGGMVGDTRSYKAPESTAYSSPYGGTIMDAKGIPGMGNDKSLEGLSTGLSDLSVQENMARASGGTDTSVSGPDAGFAQPGYMSNDQKKIPPAVAPKSYRPVRPGHLQQPSSQSGSPGHSPYQPESGLPGYQPPEYHYQQPLNQAFQPDQHSYQPGEPEYQIGKHDSQTGLPSDIQTGNYQQSPSEYPPKPPHFESEQPGYQQGRLGNRGDQTGSQSNYQQDIQSGFLPGQQGYLSPGGNESKPYESESPYPSDEHEFPAPPPELLAGYPSGYTGGDAASSDSGVELYDNIGAKLRARLDEEGVRTPLQQMLAKERNIQSNEAMQAPYGAHLDTLAGGMSIAPGSDVNVLFPGESQLLGTPGKQSRMGGHKSKYSCQGCSLPMNVGDVAIFCERAGEDKCWHPACFSCYTCKELLADLIYFYKDGKVFCGRHFTDAEEMPRCKACDELIFGNAWTRADGFDWHINHFCCNVCDTPLAGQRYVPDKNGFPYCLPCYMSYVAKMCEGCEEKISPEENRCGHRGYFYHATPQCFKCYTCQESLLGKRFKMSKNWVFCSNECIQKVAEDLANNPNPKTKEEI